MAVHISSEIRNHIGDEQADRFARTRLFTCDQCAAPGDASTQPAVATLTISPELSSLGVAHQRCAPEAAIRRVASGQLRVAERTEIVPRAIGIPTPGGMRPAVLLAWEEQVFLLPAKGATTSPVQQSLLDQGLHRLPSLGKPAPPSPGWLIRQGPGEALQVDGPQHRHLEDGRMTAPPAWRALVAPAGEVTLLMGQLDRAALYATEPPWTSYGQALREGHLLTGKVPATLL